MTPKSLQSRLKIAKNAKFGSTESSKNIRLATDNGQIMGYCGVFSTRPGREYEIMACTHPTQRGRGIGTSLMQWAEARILEKHSLASSGEQVLVHCNNFNQNVAGTQLLLDLGYQRARSFYEMKIEMTDVPAPPVWPAGITVRNMIANQDEERVFRVNEEAFRNHSTNADTDSDTAFKARFAKWLEGVRAVPDYDPDFFFIAQEGDEIAGVALAFPKDPEFPEMCWLQSLGVRRSWRRRGIALALLQHLFTESYRRGIDKVVLTVESRNPTGATQLYEKAGMHIFLQKDVYEKELYPGK